MIHKIIVIGFVILLFIISFEIVLNTQKRNVDPNTDCLIGEPQKSIVAIIFDQSDKFENGDKENDKAKINNIIYSLSQGDRLIFIEPNTTSYFEPILIFDKCVPKQPKNSNILFDSSKELKAKWASFESSFQEKIKPSLEKISSPKSPILETLSYLNDTDYFKNTQNKSVYIFSDMIQNTEYLNFYNKIPMPEKLDFLHIPIKTFNILNVSFYISYASRRHQWKKMAEVREFWNKWFTLNGAKFIEMQ